MAALGAALWRGVLVTIPVINQFAKLRALAPIHASCRLPASRLTHVSRVRTVRNK